MSSQHRRLSWRRSTFLLILGISLTQACKKEKENVTDDGKPKPPQAGTGLGNGSGGGGGGGGNGDSTGMSVKDALGILLLSHEIYATPPESKDQEDPFMLCLGEALKQVTVTAKGGVIEYAFEAEGKNCLNSVAGNDNQIFNKVTYLYEARSTCRDPNTDYTHLNGRLLSSISAADLGDCATPGDFLSFAITSSITKLNVPDKAGKPHKLSFDLINRQYRGDAQKKDCNSTWQNGKLTNENTCLNIEEIVQDKVMIDDVAANEYNGMGRKQLDQQKGLLADLGAKKTWYDAGDILFDINKAWRGKLSYTDGNTSPTYEMNNGKDPVKGELLKDAQAKSFAAAMDDDAMLATELSPPNALNATKVLLPAIPLQQQFSRVLRESQRQFDNTLSHRQL